MVKAFARRTDRPWLEPSDPDEISPASIWGPVQVQDARQEEDFSEPVLKEEDTWWSKPDLTEEEPPEAAAAEVQVAPPEVETTELASPPIPIEPEAEDPDDIEDTVEPAPKPVVTVPKVISKVRVLDESSVLPHEASFATIALAQKNPARSYSPTRELGTKLIHGLKKSVQVLLVIAVFGAAIAFVLKFNSAEPSSSAAPTPIVTTQPKPPVQVETTAEPKPAPPEPVRDVVKPAEVKRSITSSRKVRANEAPRPQRVPEKKPVTSETVKATSRPPETTTPITGGGGERPRRVNPQTSSQKPKVINWP